jgi:hypothetical protein
MTSAAPRLITEQHGRVLTVRFNNPPRNFFDEQTSIELDDLTYRLRRDDSVGAVVFTGQHDIYMTHFDMDDLVAACRSTPMRIGYHPARLVAAAARVAPCDCGRPIGCFAEPTHTTCCYGTYLRGPGSAQPHGQGCGDRD